MEIQIPSSSTDLKAKVHGSETSNGCVSHVSSSILLHPSVTIARPLSDRSLSFLDPPSMRCQVSLQGPKYGSQAPFSAS